MFIHFPMHIPKLRINPFSQCVWGEMMESKYGYTYLQKSNQSRVLNNAVCHLLLGLHFCSMGIFFPSMFQEVWLTILKVTMPDPSHFQQMLKIPPKTWSASQRVLENHCSDLLGDLIWKADIAQSAIAAHSWVWTRSTKGTPYTPSRLGWDLSRHTLKAQRINAAAHLLMSPKSAAVNAKESGNETSNDTIVIQLNVICLEFVFWDKCRFKETMGWARVKKGWKSVFTETAISFILSIYFWSHPELYQTL